MKGVYKMYNNHISSALDDYLENLKFQIEHPNEVHGLPTGFKNLDYAIDGLKAGELILIGGRLGMGKTSFAVNIAYNISNYFYNNHKDKCVLYFNLAIPNYALIQRFISKDSGLDFSSFIKKATNPTIQENIQKSTLSLSRLPIYLSNNAIDLEQIKEQMQRINAQKQIGCVIIDYLQLIGGFKQTEDCTHILCGLKELAKEFEVPIIVLTQLKRTVENRSNKIPRWSDIRGFNANHDAVDKIIFLYREAYYLAFEADPKKRKNETEEHYIERLNDWHQRKLEVQNQCDIIIEKNTSNGSATLKVLFNQRNGIFSEDLMSDFS